MIEQFIVFSKTGTVLWNHMLSKIEGNPINELIQRVLLEDRSGEKETCIGMYTLKWNFENSKDLVLVVMHQKILQVSYAEELLKRVKMEFVKHFATEIDDCEPVEFNESFTKILRQVQGQALLRKSQKPQRSFQSKDNTIKKPKEQEERTQEFEELKLLPKSKGKTMKTGPRKKKKPVKESKAGKKKTKWDDSKLSKDEIKALDRSEGTTMDEQTEEHLREMRQAYIGEDEGSQDEEDWTSGSEDEDQSDSSTGSESSSKWSFGRTRVGEFLQTISGNKVLDRDDLKPVVEAMRTQLISKNVASEVAQELSESITTTLMGKKLESFTRISTMVRDTMESALVRILTPKKSTDILREVLASRAQGKTYTVVFIGVNGVGKSTSLSKVAYYLKSKGVKVMIAACDTFRSGAVEQLNQHAKVLDIPLFERGYAKDPASVARDAVKHANENGFDCVLIDTAGRMQNNEPLMRALAKLVATNSPDLVLFVGEALVGNDGVDQLELFDRALADYSDRPDPHRVDGIVLTKFDTIDDKVGAAVSMVYKTGQPIMFVGTGQKYTNLKKLNVRTVLRHLLDS